MDWREILGQLEARLERMAEEGLRYLNVAEDAALAETLAETLREVAPAGADAAAPAPPGPRRGRAAALASRLRGDDAQAQSAQAWPVPAEGSGEPLAGAGAPSAPTAGVAGQETAEAGEAQSLESLAFRFRNCMACALGGSRNRLVFGTGNSQPAILFIGEGPGAEEDQQGLPFVGRAGALLTGLIEALGLSREDTYITNVIKCRPPGNRTPRPEEAAACRPILERQIELLNPRLIVTLGNVPLKALRPNAAGITRERGSTFSYRSWRVLPTFHPSYLLRSPAAIETCWKDFRQAFELAYGEERA